MTPTSTQQPEPSWSAPDIETGQSEGRLLPATFYQRDAATVARALLGCLLIRQLDGERLVVRIVETEAYLGAPDRASHAWAGRRTARNASLYLAGGHAYVYFVYGMHFCLNVVTGDREVGSAVLLRAGEPLEGTDAMIRRRSGGRRSRAVPAGPPAGWVAGGPARLAQALGVDRALDGLALEGPELSIVRGASPVSIATGPRVGIDYAGDAVGWPLRFAESGSPHVSRPWPPGHGWPARPRKRKG